ncbi:unnamed protein product [Parnassius apollo]|uniref:(apollo) hypothetical protein n=1 Tax=Parnassius apollo TaxID=110799 RepID=A0A8S3WD08_PARAO|nr:unnamed protein product [Parnassius apollo]
MGKPNKKIKSDRINALRKQYDAFLEEDKKRKDRNEYILERLDEMRCCTMTAQVRHEQKANSLSDFDQQTQYDRKTYIRRTLPSYDKSRSRVLNQQTSPSVQGGSLNEAALLKEISKKYILIPRYTNMIEYDNNLSMKSNIDDNNDWKSKYNILEELKKSEKEEEPRTEAIVANELTSRIKNNLEPKEKIKEVKINDDDCKNDFKNNIYNENHVSTTKTLMEKEYSNNIEECQAESPIKENTDISKVLRNENCNAMDSRVAAVELTEKEKIQNDYEILLKPKEEYGSTKEIEYNNQKRNINIDNQEATQALPKTEKPQPYETNVMNEENIEKQNIYSKSENSDTVATESSNIYNALHEPPSDINLEQTKITDNTSVNNHNELLLNEEVLQEVSNLKEGSYDVSQDRNNQNDTKISTDIEFIEPIDLVQQYEQPEKCEQNIENTFDENQVQEYEAEQQEMFYTEQRDNDYTYDQTGTNDNADIDYANNEKYNQNENYAYYEGDSQEQTYPREIDEHEESTEQYDPHYEDQYGNYDQNPPQNESVEQYGTEDYINQQDYNQLQYEQTDYNSEKQIERQLDSEQDYVEPHNIIEENNESNMPQQTIQENVNTEQEATVK